MVVVLVAACVVVVAVDFITTEVPLDPKPAMDYFGFPFRRLAEGLREYL